MAYYGFPTYVSVAELQKKSLRAIKKLKKQGIIAYPVQVEKRTITHTFWGKAWCKHIESFSDFENRLPRGRRYVRHGGVCHLTIDKGKISAKVMGNSLYDVDISIKPLSTDRWNSIQNQCSGQIGSLIELLQGNLSDAVMNVVCDQQNGLFPMPDEINMSCSCLDWAVLCKHAAAVLYGVGVRLDYMPMKLFELRGVNHEDLVDISAVLTEVNQQHHTDHRSIAAADVSDIFGIDIENETTQKSSLKESAVPAQHKENATRPKISHVQNHILPSQKSIRITGARLKRKRTRLRLTQKQLSVTIGVSVSTIGRWEKKSRQQLKVSQETHQRLQKFLGTVNLLSLIW